MEQSDSAQRLEQVGRSLGIAALVGIIVAVLRRNVRLWLRFRASFFTDIVASLVPSVIFLLIGRLVSDKATTMDYGQFLAVGLVAMRLLDCSLNAPYQSIAEAYWMCRLEAMLLTPTPLWVPVLADVLWAHIRAVLDLVLLGVVIVLLGVRLSWPAEPPVFAGALVLGAVGTLGMGLASASSFTLINAKGWSDPFRWLVSTFAGLLSGAYFPATLLPPVFGKLSLLLPHTLVLDICRSLLAPSAQGLAARWGLERAIEVLALTATAWLVTGMALFAYSIRRSSYVGGLSRWV